MHKMLKYIAPKTITINGGYSPCDCTDTLTCAYCVQANLILMEKKFRETEESQKTVLNLLRKKGPRRAGRLLEVDHKTVSYWIKTGIIPDKYHPAISSWGNR